MSHTAPRIELVRITSARVLAAGLLSILASCGAVDEEPASEGTASTGTEPAVVTPPKSMQAAERQAMPSRVGGAMLYMPESRIDFGTVADYETREVKVAFFNTGDQVLEITKVQPTCGCTTTALDQKLFAPGEGAEIELTFKPKGSGRQTKLVKVFTNDSASPVQNISINATVTSTVSHTPKSLSYGLIPLGSAGAKSLTLTSQNPTFQPTTARVSGQLGKYADARIIETSSPGSAVRSWKVEVTTRPDLPWGWHTGSLLVRGTLKDPEGASRNKDITVGMNANVQGTLRVSDPMFRLMILGTDEQFTKTVQVFREDGRPFTIRSATISNARPDNMTVTVVPAKDGSRSSYDLLLTGTTGPVNGSILGQVELVTDVPGEENVRLGVVGSVRKK